MATTFTCFPRLPPELRSRIWSLAIRPQAPGTYFYYLDLDKASAHRYDEGFTLQDFTMEDESPSADDTLHVRDSLGEDRSNEELDSSQADAEPSQENHDESPSGDYSMTKMIGRSSHLWDAGLWTACHESRDVVRRHYTLLRDHLGTSGSKSIGWHINSRLSRLSKLSAANAWELSLEPRRDLVCCLPLKPGSRRGWYAPTFRHSMGFDNPLEVCSNFAIVMDDAWPRLDSIKDFPSVLKERTARAILFQSIEDLVDDEEEDIGTQKFWLIDPSIRLLPEFANPSGWSSRKVFHGIDRVFVECSRHEINQDTSGRGTAFELLDYL